MKYKNEKGLRQNVEDVLYIYIYIYIYIYSMKHIPGNNYIYGLRFAPSNFLGFLFVIRSWLIWRYQHSTS